MVKKEIFVLLICFTLASLVSAQLSVSETDDVYNLGDRLYVSIDGIVGADSGNLNLNLVCGNSTTNLLKISARAFPKGEGSSYSLPYKIISADDLEISDIGRVVGECNLQASLGSQRASGATFKISDNIIVAASSDKKYYNPGETMTLLIGVEKENGAEYSGEIRLSNFTEDLVLIENEKKLEVEIDSDLAAGEYMINFDLEDGQGNVGSESLLFNVNQVASKIGFGVNKLEIYPGESVSISGEVLDQSGELMYETIDFEITSPRGLVITETLQIGEDILDVSFPYNSTKGEWRIVATSAGLRDELEIEILPSSHLIYDISSNILTVTNIGNELFDGYFNITIAGEQRRVFARLEPAESGQFELSAPSGDYEINLNDGKSTFAGSTFLTGNAVSVKDLNGGVGFWVPLMWLILVAVLGIGGYILIQKNPKTKKISEKFPRVKKIKENMKSKAPKKYTKEVSKTLNFTTKSPEVQSIDEKNYKTDDSTMKDLTLNKLKSAESSLVLKGEKISGSVLALKITNYEQLNEHSKQNLESIIDIAKGSHAVIDKRSNYIFLLFVPQVTKTYRNELLATKTGIQILEALTAFNKKYKQKILFNMGINSGEMVISKSAGKIKYTSLGNTLSFAKRLSDTSNAKLIINDEVRKKLLRDLKVEKHVTLNEKQTFSVISIKDREANQEKLKDLLKRM